MLNIHRSPFSRALFYTSLLTFFNTGLILAMNAEEDPGGRDLAIRAIPGGIEIGNLNPEDLPKIFAQLFAGVPQLGAGAPQDAIVLDIDSNPFHAKGKVIINILESMQWKNAKVGDRYKYVMAKKFNTALREDNTQASRQFSALLKEKCFSEETVCGLSELTYGMQKLEENYYSSMVEKLRGERSLLMSGIFTEDGYACDYIHPKDRNARLRFIEDAVHIFSISGETSEEITSLSAKSRFNDFYSFIKEQIAKLFRLEGLQNILPNFQFS